MQIRNLLLLLLFFISSFNNGMTEEIVVGADAIYDDNISSEDEISDQRAASIRHSVNYDLKGLEKIRDFSDLDNSSNHRSKSRKNRRN